MASPLAQKIQVAVVTATLTSAVWIVVGSVVLDWPRADPTPTASPPAAPAPQRTAPTKAAAPAHGGMPVSRVDQAEVSQLIVPVLDVRPAELLDTFNDDRGGGSRLHEAIDIMAPAGTTVLAAGPGTIEKLFVSDQGGNTIYVRSNDRKTIHYYAHLREYAPGLQEGQRIRRGQRLGTVGSSGNADPAAPHLHFSIMRTTPAAQWWEPAIAINPYPLLTAG